MASELSALGASVGYGQVASSSATDAAQGGVSEAVRSAATDFADAFDRADQAVNAMARGEGNAQAVVEAMAQAELALQAAVTVRDRVVEAYQEILRMPV